MRAWLVSLVVLLAAGCAPMPGPADDTRALGPAVPRFFAEGRISVRQGDRRDHLRFRWEHAPDSDVVLLMSPLGQGLAELARDASGARLKQPGQPVVAAEDLPRLAQRIFSAPLPLDAVADWLRGARPELAGEVDGWRVAVGETAAVRARRLVRVMEASRGDVDFRLVVDDWDLPE